jgi:Spy/CpxP family protein refolding chaperone
VDESQTLAQLEKVLAAEREIKREQVTLLVRIKNKLTPEQQGKLLELRNKPANR